MGLKYYLRGLGVGIVVTALIMGIAARGEKETLSDEEIRERARALGMVEQSTVLADTVGMTGKTPEEETDPVPLPTPEATAKPTAAPEATATATKEPSPTPSSTTAREAEPEETQTPSPTPEATPTATPTATPVPSDSSDTAVTNGVTIQIAGGESSFAVCRKLEQAGLIESASEYDTYLCQNGYDKRIRAGSHKIPIGSDAEQIIQIITKTN